MINNSNSKPSLTFKDFSEELCSSANIQEFFCTPHLDTNAGSNPREFQGLTAINEEIIKSFLTNKSLFPSKHSGIHITLTNTDISIKNSTGTPSLREGKIEYDDVCLSNGLQTVTLFRILFMIKAYQLDRGKDGVHTKITKKTEGKLVAAVRKYSPNQQIADFLIEVVPLNAINSLLNWFRKDENISYLNIFNEMSIEDILNCRINFKAIFLDKLINDCDSNTDSLCSEDYIKQLGYDCATATNNTQTIKEDDKFGTLNKGWLEEKLMNQIPKEDVYIVYRNRENIKTKVDCKKHILDLLRAIIPTTILVDDKDEKTKYLAHVITRFCYNRIPIYKFFEKVIQENEKHPENQELNKAIKIISNLMPQIFNLMMKFEYELKIFYHELGFEKIMDLLEYDDKSKEKFKHRIGCDEDSSEEQLDKAVKKQLTVSQSVLFPLFIFASKKFITIDSKLNVAYEINEDDISSIIPILYLIVLKNKLNKQYSTQTDLYRSPEIYSEAELQLHLFYQNKYKNKDDISRYRVNIAKF